MGMMEAYHYYWTESADPEMAATVLYGSPLWIPILSISYLYFVLVCGPRFMKDRKPYSLTTFIKYYNIFQIVANAIVVYRNVIILQPWDTAIFCQSLRDTNPEKYQMVTELLWYILVLKIIDYIETFVFVLRKKNNQISFLHLYHHVSTVHIIWSMGRYLPGALISFIFGVNSGIHVLMYTYYLLSTTKNSALQTILKPIKRLMTILQMVQLVYLIFVTCQSFTPGCYVTKSAAVATIIDITINLILFANFYIKSYKKKKTV